MYDEQPLLANLVVALVFAAAVTATVVAVTYIAADHSAFNLATAAAKTLDTPDSADHVELLTTLFEEAREETFPATLPRLRSIDVTEPAEDRYRVSAGVSVGNCRVFRPEEDGGYRHEPCSRFNTRMEARQEQEAREQTLSDLTERTLQQISGTPAS